MTPSRTTVFALAVLSSLGISPAAGQDRAGVFDYYVLSLSWSPNWCRRAGDARGAAQCELGAGLGWTLHGLWPQYVDGWPEWCDTDQAGPSQGETDAMADIMGSAGLAAHEWDRHGTCSGLSASDYFALSRRAYDAVTRPARFAQTTETTRLPAAGVEAAFLSANPGLSDDGVTITCRDRAIHEIRICLTRELSPRPCTGSVAADCRVDAALMAPPR